MRPREFLAARVLACVTLPYVLAVTGGCSRTNSSGAKPNAPAPTTLVVADPVDHLDVLALEPMIVEHPDGTLFVSGYEPPVPPLWKSRDRGLTWTRVNVGTAADGAIGNSDVDLGVGRDGTLYFVAMVFDRKALKGTHISIGVSRDMGATWSWTLLSKTPFSDRPWVEVAPDGTAHVIWNDSHGVCHAVSKNRGITWTERPRIHAQGSSSHLAVGPHGEVAVRITPFSFFDVIRATSGFKIDQSADLIAVSTDAGATWHKHAAPGQREWTLEAAEAVPMYPLVDKGTPPRWVEPIAWDDQGALYSLWTNRKELWVARSVDRGEKWTTWRVDGGGDIRYFPYLVARGRGQLAATWFSGRAETLQAHVARIEVGPGNEPPRFIESQPFRPDSWRPGESSGDSPIRDPDGEYLAATFLGDGGLAIVSPIENKRTNRFGFSYWRIDAR